MIRADPTFLIDVPQRVRTRVAVIGSGPGGAITAAILAEAGREVLLIEEGEYLPLESCPPFSRTEMTQKYRNGGITVAMGRTKVAYVEGRCVGGGSEINSGLYHRAPAEILDEWRRQYQVERLTEEELRPYYEANERDLNVSLLPGPAPAASLRLADGAQRLGWRALEVPRWFRNEAGAGARMSMTRTFVPRALAAGATLLPDCRVLRLRRREGLWQLSAEHAPLGARRPITIEAECVFVACGAIQTAALLRRSGIGRRAGRTLHMHPTIKAVARFAHEVNTAGMGVPVHQVKEFAPRYSLGCSISGPPHLALALLDRPQALRTVARDWPFLAVYYAMTRGGRGTVRTVPGFRDPLVRYRLDPSDRRELAEALRALCHCLLAAGATAVHPSLPLASAPVVSRESDLRLLPEVLPASASLMTIHLFSTCPMGEDRRRCVADSLGRVHGQPGLYLADGSLLCGPPGVNPQGTIMALARRNAVLAVAG